MNKSTYKLLGTLAGLSFAAAAAVHGLTFLGVTVPGAFVLHIAALALFFPAVIISSTAQRRQKRPNSPWAAFAILAPAPLWMKIVLPLCFLYTGVNFLLFMALSGGGGPHQEAGKYYIMNHGVIIRELTASEYHWQQAYVARGFSGHWLLFLFAAWTIYTAAARRAQDV